jgi:hypothetical protein
MSKGNTMSDHGKLRIAGLILIFFVFSGIGYAGDWPQYKRDSARRGDAPDEVLNRIQIGN